jgi:hypothetical protein
MARPSRFSPEVRERTVRSTPPRCTTSSRYGNSSGRRNTSPAGVAMITGDGVRSGQREPSCARQAAPRLGGVRSGAGVRTRRLAPGCRRRSGYGGFGRRAAWHRRTSYRWRRCRRGGIWRSRTGSRSRFGVARTSSRGAIRASGIDLRAREDGPPRSEERAGRSADTGGVWLGPYGG